MPDQGKLLESKLRGRPVISVNFSVTGTEVEFIDLRKRLKEFVPIVNCSAVPEHMLTLSLDTKNTFAKHAEFELQGLKSYWLRLIDLYSVDDFGKSTVDEHWYRHIIIPRWVGYSFVALCYSI